MQLVLVALRGDETHEKKGYGQSKGNTGHGADQEFFRETAFFKSLIFSKKATPFGCIF
jgi:hypothetical protein